MPASWRARRGKRLHKLFLQLLSLRRSIFKRPKNNTSQDHPAHNLYINGIAAIIQSPLLSSLFREFLENTHCLENFTFYLKVSSFIAHYDQRRHASTRPEINDDALEDLHSKCKMTFTNLSNYNNNNFKAFIAPLLRAVPHGKLISKNPSILHLLRYSRVRLMIGAK